MDKTDVYFSLPLFIAVLQIIQITASCREGEMIENRVEGEKTNIQQMAY